MGIAGGERGRADDERIGGERPCLEHGALVPMAAVMRSRRSARAGCVESRPGVPLGIIDQTDRGPDLTRSLPPHRDVLLFADQREQRISDRRIR